MKKLILSTALLAITATASFADTVRMGTEGAYPPYNFINDDGEVAGFEREVGDKLCEIAELTCEWVTNEWDTIIPNLLSANYDTIIAGMSITEEREEVIDFTQDYYPPTASAYASVSDGVDLMGGVIAAQTSTIQAGHVATTGATLVEFATLDDTIAAVKNGEVDAVFADKDALVPFVEEQDFMFLGDDVPLGKGIGMGLRESDAELKAKFDAAIDVMKADGSLNALLIKYFGEETATY
ncbi:MULTISPECIES: transporter substrate-binding domain-containing protein [Pacificibacter]|uniref:transporter substrate-binding domain-containing protein n=1 Tax=Pacificibacter TaxID=1042323 RepID=UPI001C093227|nr:MULTISPECIES: transporter substrate-binding domain-containing protein [Pacificibacter]MBU2935831.1 transporter substrate-binding domain-containing protein [Pacificibacter marinus]MDO6614326.1 transporter substrate-binding domain-containing protein [Pacificibacter sp. 1_MG-2023]